MKPLDDNGIDSADACAHGDYVRDERKGEDAIRAQQERFAQLGARVLEILTQRAGFEYGADNAAEARSTTLVGIEAEAGKLGLWRGIEHALGLAPSGLDKFRERRQGK